MSHTRSMTGPPSAWRATALAVAALLFVSTSPDGAGQALPDFLSEARATAPQDVTVERVQRWAQRAEEFLRESDASSGAREDVYLQLLDWVELLSGDRASNEMDEVIGAYFAEFPEGRFRDEFEWKRLRYNTNRDRFETPNDGATMVVSAARGYESYLASRPNTRMADEIKLIIGAEYHTASELIQYFPELNGAYSAREGVEFRTRGRNIWRNLLGSTDEEVALKAALYLSQQDVFFGSPPRRNNDNIRSGRGRAVLSS